jgi:hypothetical protein
VWGYLLGMKCAQKNSAPYLNPCQGCTIVVTLISFCHSVFLYRVLISNGRELSI